jgi:hypothetical protein
MSTPTSTPSIFAAWNDAGLLREYTARRYRSFLCFGGSLDTARRFEGCVRRLRALTGLDRYVLVRDLTEDADAMGW